MEMIFQELDTNDSSEMEIEELTDRIQDPTIAAYFSRIGVDVDQVQKLFKLLDQDQSGSIDKEEFMFGCLRLQGQAKSFDIAILQHDMKAIRKYIVALGEAMGTWMDEQVQLLLGAITPFTCASKTTVHTDECAISRPQIATISGKENVAQVLADAKVEARVVTASKSETSICSDDESV